MDWKPIWSIFIQTDMVFSYTFSYKHFYVHLFFILHQLEKVYIFNVIRVGLACNIIIKKPTFQNE